MRGHERLAELGGLRSLRHVSAEACEGAGFASEHSLRERLVIPRDTFGIQKCLWAAGSGQRRRGPRSARALDSRGRHLRKRSLRSLDRRSRRPGVGRPLRDGPTGDFPAGPLWGEPWLRLGELRPEARGAGGCPRGSSLPGKILRSWQSPRAHFSEVTEGRGLPPVVEGRGNCHHFELVAG